MSVLSWGMLSLTSKMAFITIKSFSVYFPTSNAESRYSFYLYPIPKFQRQHVQYNRRRLELYISQLIFIFIVLLLLLLKFSSQRNGLKKGNLDSWSNFTKVSTYSDLLRGYGPRKSKKLFLKETLRWFCVSHWRCVPVINIRKTNRGNEKGQIFWLK